MAAKILILAFAAVIWKAECQLSGETIYQNPLRPPYAAESSVSASSAASASSGSDISQIPIASLPNSLSAPSDFRPTVPFSQSSQVSSSASSTTTSTVLSTESTLESLSTPLGQTNELVDKTFSESSLKTKFGFSAPSKPCSAKMDSMVSNYSSKRLPSFVKNNITAFIPPPTQLDVPTLDKGIINKPQYLQNPSPRPYTPAYSSRMNYEGLRKNPNVEQNTKQFSSVSETLTSYNNPLSNYYASRTNSKPEETPRYLSSASKSPHLKRTLMTTDSKIGSFGSNFNSQYDATPKTFSSTTEFCKVSPTPGVSKNTIHGSLCTPKAEEAASSINYESELSEVIKLNHVPSFVGVTGVINTDYSPSFETPELNIPSYPYPQQPSLSFSPFDSPQASFVSTNLHSPDFIFYPEVMSPTSIYSGASKPIISPAQFSKTAAETSSSISSGLKQSDSITSSGATSFCSAQATPSFPNNINTPVSSVPSTQTSISIAEVGSSASTIVGQSSAAEFLDISSLGSAKASSNTYLQNPFSLPLYTTSPQTSISMSQASNSASPVKSSSTAFSGSSQTSSNLYLPNSRSPSVSFSSLPPTKFATNSQSSVNIADSTTYSSPSVSSTSSLPISDTDNPIISPYTASKTMNNLPIAAQCQTPAVISPIISVIASTTSSNAAADNLGPFTSSYSAAEATSGFYKPVEFTVPMTYSPSEECVTPIMPSTYPISTSYAASESISAIPITTETFVPVINVPATENETPITSSIALSTSSSSISYGSSDTLDVAPIVSDTIAPLTYPTTIELISPITSSAISETTSSISTSYAPVETIGCDPTLTEILLITPVAETIQSLPVVDTITTNTASISTATELVDPISSVSTSSSTATTSTFGSTITNSMPAIQQISTSSALSYATPDITTPFSTYVTNPTFSRPCLPSQNLYNLEICPVTIEVQIPSSLGSSYVSPGFQFPSSRTRNAISPPLMYELQIPSSMAAQLSCTLGTAPTNVPILCMNVENALSSKYCY